jgi:hypothetical protein
MLFLILPPFPAILEDLLTNKLERHKQLLLLAWDQIERG